MEREHKHAFLCSTALTGHCICSEMKTTCMLCMYSISNITDGGRGFVSELM